MFRRRLLPAMLALFLAPVTVARAADWPQFRGPDRDGTSRETGLLRAWPEGGPELLWETSMGQGYSAAAIHSGKVYVNDYDESTSSS